MRWREFAGTAAFCAPEALKAGPQCQLELATRGNKADVWSLGCVVYEMLTGGIPYKDRLQGQGKEFGWQIMFQVASGAILHPTIPEDLPEDCDRFLQLCFDRNCRTRPDISMLLNESFLRAAIPIGHVEGCICGCSQPDHI